MFFASSGVCGKVVSRVNWKTFREWIGRELYAVDIIFGLLGIGGWLAGPLLKLQFDLYALNIFYGTVRMFITGQRGLESIYNTPRYQSPEMYRRMGGGIPLNAQTPNIQPNRPTPLSGG